MGYYLIEEAHEAKEAIDGGSPRKIKEELGDLLFQLLTVIEISEERGEFTLSQVIEQVACLSPFFFLHTQNHSQSKR
jgi:NTP pyrophosphatase (non-canonical NTP hydrolase)